LVEHDLFRKTGIHFSGSCSVGSERRRLRMAAQQAAPIAVAKADAAAAKRLLRTIVELIFKTAVIGAIRAATEGIGSAMVAKPPRQRLRVLPIDLKEPGAGRRGDRRRRRADRGGKASEQREC
jgi:hypothetical protein